MATHAFITTWLLAPSGAGGVDWGAGRELGSEKGVFHGNHISGSIRVTKCGANSVYWDSKINESSVLGTKGKYKGPDVYVFFKNAAGNEIGGFLDHWNGPATERRRSFNGIRKFWKCRNGRPMNPTAVYNTAAYVQIGLQGDKKSILSPWFKLH